jgi:hypothetical protein
VYITGVGDLVIFYLLVKSENLIKRIKQQTMSDVIFLKSTKPDSMTPPNASTSRGTSSSHSNSRIRKATHQNANQENDEEEEEFYLSSSSEKQSVGNQCGKFCEEECDKRNHQRLDTGKGGGVGECNSNLSNKHIFNVSKFNFLYEFAITKTRNENLYSIHC